MSALASRRRQVFGPDDLTVEYGPEGVACGVRVKDVVARTKLVIGDPSYFPSLVENRGKVVRAIAILDHPVQGSGEPPTQSHQIIFPNTSIGRVNDVYLFCTSASHKCAPAGKFLAFVSTNVEGPTDGMSVEAVGQRELSAGLQAPLAPPSPGRMPRASPPLQPRLSSLLSSHARVVRPRPHIIA